MNTEEIFTILNILRTEAPLQDHKFGAGRYKWELGNHIYYTLKSTLVKTVYLEDGEIVEEAPELMGIPVEINFKDPLCIKLWREIGD